LPHDSNDQTIPRCTWWSHKSSQEWVQYEFAQAQTFWRSDIFWFNDRGDCDFPQSFKIQYWNGSTFQDVALDADYANEADYWSEGHATTVRFTPVTTTRIRVLVQLKANKSGGLLEWRLPELIP
jgi:hypothetical protein